MEEMGRGRITLAALAVLVTALLAVAAGPASGAAIPGSRDGGSTTGRALIGVRTPALPVGDGRAAAERRRDRLARSRELLGRVAARAGIEVDGRSDAAGLIATELEGESVAGLRRRLASDPLVESVRPEHRFEYRYTPNDPIFNSTDVNAGGDWAQWHLRMQSFPKAWDLARAGAEVAVIDSGADLAHPDLAGRVSGTLNCAGLLCLGGNVPDTIGHGTHVGGLACADSNNGYGLASAGFDCSLFVVKTDLTFTSVINSIYAAADRGSHVINMSFGDGAADSDLNAALDYALARGSVLVAAGANEPSPNPAFNYPAQYLQPEGTGPNIGAGRGLVVTSLSHAGVRSAFAQGTNGVSVAGVGSASNAFSGGRQGILSSWPQGPVSRDGLGVRANFGGDTRFAYLVGTSMAAPQVAGLAALMRGANPALGPLRVARLAKLSAGNCGTYGTGGLGWGLINANRAVGAALGRDVDPPSSEVTSAKKVRAKKKGRRKKKRRGKKRLRRASVARDAGGAVTAGKKGKRKKGKRKKRGKKRRKNVVLRLKAADGSCSPELPASGIKAIHVFASVNGGEYRQIGTTTMPKIRVSVKRRRSYGFYSIAVDGAGNTEATPAEAEAKIRLKKKCKKKKGKGKRKNKCKKKKTKRKRRGR
jgi:serine protease